MSKQGVLLVNLGSPDSPAVGDVRRYLREFLMDGRVLDAPYPVRFCVVHFAILPSRPRESARAYQKIWLPEGSPLVVTSQRVREALQRRIEIPVELAMRYQKPSILSAVQSLRRQNVTDLLLVLLFPHYAMSSFETAVERVREVAARHAPGMSVQVVPPYFEDADYIAALAASAEPYLQRDHDHLLFSFHGLPERHLRKSDPTGAHCLRGDRCCDVPSPAHATCYRHQCFRTVQAFVKQTGIRHYSVAFQSRLGRDPWLQPFTDQVLETMPSQGIKRLLVICPAFVSDCLETLEEIGMRGKESFLKAGGRELTLIPCMNEHPRWISVLEKMARNFVQGKPVLSSRET
jgi:protoporphyrin/coproporphyrin ferrochelatase